MPLKSQVVTSSQCAQQGDRWASSLNIREREHRRGCFRGQAEEKTDNGTQLRKRPGIQAKTIACWLNRVKMEF